MATPAEPRDAPPPLTARKLRTRKAFVRLDVAATKALHALRPWMEAHVQEVIGEFYAHLLRFQQPRWLLADPQRLATGRRHERVGVTPQWYLGAYSTFVRIRFPKLLAPYRDRPLTGIAAIKALIAVITWTYSWRRWSAACGIATARGAGVG